MRKLLAGFLFRTLKSAVMWALLALSIVASFYFTSVLFEGFHCVTVIRSKDFFYTGNNDEVLVYSGNVKKYRFESLGISAYDLERSGVEPIDQEVYDLLQNEVHTAFSERWAFDGFPTSLHYASAILIAIIIPVFFGSLFSDGTIKNLVACGYSRRTIYLSALIYSFFLDLIMILLNIIVFMWFCIYYEWKPPVYVPMLLVAILVDIFVVFTVSAVVVSAMFVSVRRTVTIIVGFLMLVFIFLESNPLVEFYENHIIESDRTETEYIEYGRLVKQYGNNVFEDKIDLSTLDYEVYYEGRKIISGQESDLPVPLKTAVVTLIYLDPVFMERGGVGLASAEYIYYSNGIPAITIACNALWIAVSTCIGITFFKKRDLH